MRLPRIYIVRIYRHGYRFLTGSVEDAERAGVRGFRSLRRLGELLRAPIEPRSGPDGADDSDESTRKGG